MRRIKYAYLTYTLLYQGNGTRFGVDKLYNFRLSSKIFREDPIHMAKSDVLNIALPKINSKKKIR